MQALATWRMLEAHWTILACRRAAITLGKRMEIRTAMMPRTTRSSTSEKAARGENGARGRGDGRFAVGWVGRMNPSKKSRASRCKALVQWIVDRKWAHANGKGVKCICGDTLCVSH